MGATADALARVHRAARRHARLLEPSGDHRDADLVAHVLVDHRAEDQVDIRVRRLLDDGGGLVDLEQAHARSASHVEQDAARAVDGDVEQAAADRFLGGVAGAIFARSAAHSHQCGPALGHDGAHVSEVQVDQAGHGDQLGDALNTLAQHVVGHPKRFLQAGALVDDLQQPVVGNHDQGIHLALERLDARLGGLNAARAFEREGAGDHADRQGAQFFGDLGHHRRAAGAGATAHAAGDEDHIRAAHHFIQLVGALFGGLASNLRVAAGAQAARQLIPNTDASLGFAEQQSLRVGVDRDEFDPPQPFFNHAVDGITATTADPDHLNAGEIISHGQCVRHECTLLMVCNDLPRRPVRGLQTKPPGNVEFASAYCTAFLK